jgi:DNA-binding NtrC family response regulator
MGDLKALLERRERELIEAALAEAGGHQRRAASILGLLPSTLCEKMKRLGIPGRTARAETDTVPDPEDTQHNA